MKLTIFQFLLPFINSLNKLEYDAAAEQIAHINSPEFENRVLKGGRWFTFFGASWCHHCRAATPEWQRLEKDFSLLLESKYNLIMRKIECTHESNVQLCQKQVTDGFPSLVLFNEGKEYKRLDVNVDSATYDGFKSFLGKMIKELDSTQINWVLDKKDSRAMLDKHIQQLKELASKTFGKDPFTNPDGKVVLLTDDNFPSRINESSWCGHCKHLGPVFESIAPELKQQVNLGKVDCTTEKDVCNKYKIRGFPTLKFFQYGELIQEFKDTRTPETLKRFAKSFTAHPAFTPILAANIQEAVKENEVSFFFVYPSEAPAAEDLLEQIINVARRTRAKAKFFISPDEESFAVLGLKTKQPTLLVIKDFGNEAKIQYSRSFTKSAEIFEFIENNYKPMIPSLNAGNSEELLNSEKIVVLAIHDPKTQLKAMESFRETVRDWIGSHHSDSSVVFVNLDGKTWENYISRVFRIGAPDLPRIVIMDAANGKFYDEDEKSLPFVFEKESILNGVDAVIRGKLKGHYTNGFFSSTLKWIGKLFLPYATYANDHPFIASLLGIGLILSFLYYLTSGIDDEYNALKFAKDD